MTFFTVINCIDGRVQLPVINHIMEKHDVEFVDSITEPGPVKYLSEKPASRTSRSILERLDLSIEKHDSRGIAIVAHYDCGGNPVDKEIQIDQLHRSAVFIKSQYSNLALYKIWVDSSWKVHIID